MKFRGKADCPKTCNIEVYELEAVSMTQAMRKV
jgi:hypothetical protein